MENNMLSDSDSRTQPGIADPSDTLSEMRMHLHDMQSPGQVEWDLYWTHWTEDLQHRLQAVESGINSQDCNLSPIGGRTWQKYRIAVQALLNSRDPRSLGINEDPDHPNCFYRISPGDLVLLQQECHEIIVNFDHEVASRKPFLQVQTNDVFAIIDKILNLNKSVYYARYGIAVRAAFIEAGEYERAEKVKMWTLPDIDFFIDLQQKLDAESEHYSEVLEGEIPDKGQRSPTYGLIHTIATSCCLNPMEMVDLVRGYALTGKLKNDNLHPKTAPFSENRRKLQTFSQTYKKPRHNRWHLIKDSPIGRIPGKRNIAYSLADILEQDLLDLPKIFSVQEDEEAAIFGLVIQKLIQRWFQLDLFWGGNRDLALVENLVTVMATKDRKRSARGMASIFRWVGKEAVLEEIEEMERKGEEGMGDRKGDESEEEECSEESKGGDEAGDEIENGEMIGLSDSNQTESDETVSDTS
ncbi:hypothetical protein BKA64DRAFT_767339 [Cadophora sp. MPI-SDFR-AT-0126]|nr:hypothetical protein BKA64DRAFT_767339 [Leotiomycetes sp. MPI-SDFR-AT-0126]